ncbi:hypothetical protein DKAM_1127 [Desulfurococcus amylolyticus 1221n]|uniref:Uncharacterized protein n=1 Tax=Desulfurococcus amylolyticus (strain DSM 18924 / JCM 16383 / VKM B-2413 / 1221n) TaxID=490899 RepID=B8D5S2_DESA1|nr:hypothetical protein [Desulfurococcus amylolyticus]ACL11453.1 hypothetical protein DKAM_1127 [Desulfurococcus amylolyticus 1221n]
MGRGSRGSEGRGGKQGEDVWSCVERKVGPIVLTLFPSLVYKKELTECIEREEDHEATVDNM